jgi:hypothetical protein
MFTTNKCIISIIVLLFFISFAGTSVVSAAQISTSESAGIFRAISQGETLAPIDFYIFAKDEALSYNS